MDLGLTISIIMMTVIKMMTAMTVIMMMTAIRVIMMTTRIVIMMMAKIFTHWDDEAPPQHTEELGAYI